MVDNLDIFYPRKEEQDMVRRTQPDVEEEPVPYIKKIKAAWKNENKTHKRRLLTGPSEEAAIRLLAAKVADQAGTYITVSQLLRACMYLLLDAEKELLEKARGASGLQYPSCADTSAVSEFDYELAQVIASALQDRYNKLSKAVVRKGVKS